MPTPARSANALACANIALAKYWGKLDLADNLPAVPSLSLTLEALGTITRVEFDAAIGSDQIVLDGTPASGRPRERVVRLLDRVRAFAQCELPARVRSKNRFPTAAGLASSASGFAALALAASHAAGLSPSLEDVSDLARSASASAARSVFGGFAALGAGARHAERVAPPDHWDLRMLICVTETGPKTTGSTEGMLHTAETSPYYAAWLESAPGLYRRIRDAVTARDLEALGAAVEQSALMMHASMLAARPALMYFAPGTVAVYQAVRRLREGGVPAYCTMDAGPHVKVLTTSAHAAALLETLRASPSVSRVIVSAPGPDASLIDDATALAELSEG